MTTGDTMDAARERQSKALAAAIRIAAKVHAGQVDKAGVPYILHPLRVMGAMGSPIERIIAVLHDVLEDGDDPAAIWKDIASQLGRTGCADMEIAAIEAALRALTRGKNESYRHYIARVARDPFATPVKIADLRDNLNLARLPSVTNFTHTRRHMQALSILQRGTAEDLWPDDF